MKIINDMAQGSDEWKQLRLGKITASRLSDVMANGRSGAPSKTRQSYMLQLAAEILTGEAEDSFSNKYMDWGNACEPQARSMYEFDSGNVVEEVAFVIASDRFGVSPDGMVGQDGLLEIKCPKTTTQIDRFVTGKFPKEYKAQVQGQLLATERTWCDFVSFDPRISGPAQYFIIRVERDEDYIIELQAKIDTFTDELNNLLELLK